MAKTWRLFDRIGSAWTQLRVRIYGARRHAVQRRLTARRDGVLVGASRVLSELPAAKDIGQNARAGRSAKSTVKPGGANVFRRVEFTVGHPRTRGRRGTPAGRANTRGWARAEDTGLEPMWWKTCSRQRQCSLPKITYPFDQHADQLFSFKISQHGKLAGGHDAMIIGGNMSRQCLIFVPKPERCVPFA